MKMAYTDLNDAIIEFCRDGLGLDIPPGVVMIDLSLNYEGPPTVKFRCIDPDEPIKWVTLCDGSKVETANYYVVTANFGDED